MPQYQTVRTPCIGVCSTGIGDSVCRGCKRFDYEVINWNGYTADEKAAIDSRLAFLLSETIKRRLVIYSADLLKQQLHAQQIRFSEWRNEYCWLFELLRAGAAQIHEPADYGFRILKIYEQYSLVELREQIESESYALSIAHFERYIVANRRKATTVST